MSFDSRGRQIQLNGEAFFLNIYEPNIRQKFAEMEADIDKADSKAAGDEPMTDEQVEIFHKVVDLLLGEEAWSRLGFDNKPIVRLLYLDFMKEIAAQLNGRQNIETARSKAVKQAVEKATKAKAKK